MFSDIFNKSFELSAKRLGICNTCDQYDTKWKKCNKCGCFMEFKSLIRFAECPLNKWKDINIETDQENNNEK
mgnify:CR=1 FL=1